MNEERIISILEEVKEVFDKHQIDFWLDSGVLLGIVRNGKPISWDNDIDLCIWRKDEGKLKVNAPAYNDFQRRGFDLFFLEDKIVLEKDNYPINVSLFFLTNERAAREPYLLYGKNKVGRFLRSLWWLFSVCYYGSSLKLKILTVRVTQLLPGTLRKGIATLILKTSKIFGCKEITWSVPKKFFTNFSEVNLQGMKFKSPAPVNEYLKFRYGSDWKIPKKKWDTITEDGAIEKAQ